LATGVLQGIYCCCQSDGISNRENHKIAATHSMSRNSNDGSLGLLHVLCAFSHFLDTKRLAAAISFAIIRFAIICCFAVFCYLATLFHVIPGYSWLSWASLMASSICQHSFRYLPRVGCIFEDLGKLFLRYACYECMFIG